MMKAFQLLALRYHRTRVAAHTPPQQRPQLQSSGSTTRAHAAQHAAHTARACAAPPPAAAPPNFKTPDATHERRRTTTKRCCVPSREQSRRRRSMGQAKTRVSPRQRGPVARAGRFLFPPMRAWLEQPHGRRHKAPPQPCALTTTCQLLRIGASQPEAHHESARLCFFYRPKLKFFSLVFILNLMQ